MKNILVGTTALIAVGLVVGQARAADPIKLTLGGFYGTAAGAEIGGADGKGEPSHNTQTYAFKQNVEIYFNGSVTLDNGLTTGVHIELEGNNTAGRTIDEVWAYFRGGFGDLRFGDGKGSLELLCVADPGYITNNFGLLSPNNSFTNVGTNAAMKVGNIGVCENSGQKGTKVTYISPWFSGFQFSASFQPNQNKSAGPTTGTGSTNGVRLNLVSAAANYKHSFGDVKVMAGLGMEYNITPAHSGPTSQFYQGGLQIGYGHFTVGAAGEYMENYGLSGRQNSGSATPINNGADAWVASAGGNYAMDAWTFGLEYYHGQFQTANSSTVDKYNAVSLQTTYKFGPGMRIEGEAAYFWYNEDKVASSSKVKSATSNSASLGIGTYMTF